MAFQVISSILQLGNLRQVRNAVVEEVSNTTNTTGYIVISYTETNSNGDTLSDLLRLNVTQSTAVVNLAGRNCLCDIEVGMRVDAIFSATTTRSIPPQATAFLLLVRQGAQAQNWNLTTTDILSIDTQNGSILTGTADNPNLQMIFNVTDNTAIRNRIGFPIRLSDLRAGQTIRVVYANFQTSSIPPQTTAYYIQVI